MMVTLVPLRLIGVALLVVVLGVGLAVGRCSCRRSGNDATIGAPAPAFLTFFRVWVRLLLYVPGSTPGPGFGELGHGMGFGPVSSSPTDLSRPTPHTHPCRVPLPLPPAPADTA